MIYLDAAKCKKTSRPPVWMMRQAGRYMPEYRAIRQGHSFKEMIHNPELATEITLQPIKAFGMDAAIVFSDILVTSDALGVEFDFIEGKGPVTETPVRVDADILNLRSGDVSEHLEFVGHAITLLKKELDIPLIGFAGAPFTVASYMIEGRSNTNLSETKKMLMHDPKRLHQLLDRLTTITISYLESQIKAGADALQLFDTWAGNLSWHDFHDIALPYIKQIVTHITEHHDTPITVFAKHSSTYAPVLATAKPNVISLDWQCALNHMKHQIPHDIALQGNFDPALLNGDKAELKKRVNSMCRTMADRPGYIFNLGHGITPDISPDNVKVVVDTVKAFSN